MKKKINFNKGFYRLFVFAACAVVFFAMYLGIGTFDYMWQAVLCSFLCGAFVYFSFFFLEWIIMGFVNSEDYDKNFVRTIISKISQINFFLPFIYCLGFSLLLCLCVVYEHKNKIEIEEPFLIQVDNLKRENSFLQSQVKELKQTNSILQREFDDVLGGYDY